MKRGMSQKEGKASLKEFSPHILNVGMCMDVDKPGTEKFENILENALGESSCKTLDAAQTSNSDCYVVENKFLSMISDESHHSKWEEFRRMAKQDSATEECSALLRRMELEASEEELDPSDIEKMEDADQLCNLEEEACHSKFDKEALSMRTNCSPRIRKGRLSGVLHLELQDQEGTLRMKGP